MREAFLLWILAEVWTRRFELAAILVCEMMEEKRGPDEKIADDCKPVPVSTMESGNVLRRCDGFSPLMAHIAIPIRRAAITSQTSGSCKLEKGRSGLQGAS